MNYLIWGTGKIATNFVHEQLSGYFRHHALLAFVDNNNQKWNSLFFNYRVISPDLIDQYDFDRILICAASEGDIRKQLQYSNVPNNKIINIQDLKYEYAAMLKEKVYQKTFLIIDSDFERYSLFKSKFSSLINIGGYIDRFDLDSIRKYQEYDYILIMNLTENSNKKVDRKADEEFIQYLSQYYGIRQEIIITINELTLVLTHTLLEISLGDENSEKKFMVIKTGEFTGPAAFVNRVVLDCLYAKEHNYIPVVDWTSRNICLEEDEVGVINAWEKFFEQPAGISLKDIEHSKYVAISFGIKETGGLSVEDAFDILKMKPNLKKTVDLYYNKLITGGKILGVLYRGTDYVNKKPYGHSIQPSTEEMILKIKELDSEWGEFDYIYLCTEDEKALKSFIKEFGNKIQYYPQKRIPQNYKGYLANFQFDDSYSAYQRGADYFAAILILSRCTSLIAGDCSGTRLAVGLNKGQYEHTYIFDLGKYGKF